MPSLWGMFIPPNWVGLGAFALLGIENPGFWVVGAGLELAYLLTLSSGARFHRLIDGQQIPCHQAKHAAAGRRAAYPAGCFLIRIGIAKLADRCQKILEQQHDASAIDLQPQADGLGKLLYVYLRLLLTRTGILRDHDARRVAIHRRAHLRREKATRIRRALA